MGMRVHELHSAAVHAPLAILPTAATVDLAAALTSSRALSLMGSAFWALGAGTALFAGAAGLAASQEVRAEDSETSDMMWLHGAGNLALVTTAFGMTAYRGFRRPSLLQASVGLLAVAGSAYTAYLGAQLVYQRGVGVNAMPASSPRGVGYSPPLLSRSAAGALVSDAVAGLKWLFSRAADLANHRARISRESFGLSPAPLKLPE